MTETPPLRAKRKLDMDDPYEYITSVKQAKSGITFIFSTNMKLSLLVRHEPIGYNFATLKPKVNNDCLFDYI